MKTHSAASAVARLRKPHASVLAVTPDSSDQLALTSILSSNGYRVYCPASARAARLFLPDPNIGILICDTELPDDCWYRLLDEARRRNPAPGFIVACRPGEWMTHALRRGACDILTKPFEAEQTLFAVSVAAREWQFNRACASGRAAKVYTVEPAVPRFRRLLALCRPV